MTKFLRIIFILSVFGWNTSFALDQTIRVLGVYTGGANVPVSEFLLTRIVNDWNATTIISSVSVTLANGGVLEVLSSTQRVGTDIQQLIDAKTGTLAIALASLRAQHSADIVIVFTGTFSNGVCGLAGQSNWTSFDQFGQPDGSNGVFIPNVNGLDLNGANTSHVAIVATSTSINCGSHVAAHEFGHLLGGGHEGTGNVYLDQDSHAYVKISSGGRITGRKSVLATADPLDCLNADISCVTKPVYSSSTFGVSGSMNANTFTQTAFSVANYITNPTCVVSAPENVIGVLLDVCEPPPFTTYFMTWTDSCPAATEFYEIWVKQPITSLYVFNTVLPTLATAAFIDVAGDDAFVKVKACDNNGTCILSNSFMSANAFACP